MLIHRVSNANMPKLADNESLRVVIRMSGGAVDVKSVSEVSAGTAFNLEELGLCLTRIYAVRNIL